MLTILQREYEFTVTEETDSDYLKYLRRKLRHVRTVSVAPAAQSTPLDISMDDAEGDVVAGVAAMTNYATLYIDLLWVTEGLRRGGVGRRLVEMAENAAVGRGCHTARAGAGDEGGLNFYLHLGYTICGKLQTLDGGHTFYYLHKALYAAQKDLA